MECRLPPAAFLGIWCALAPVVASAATAVFVLDTDEDSFATIFRVDPGSGQLAELGALPTNLGKFVALAAQSADRLYTVAQGGEVLAISLEPFGLTSLGNVGANLIVGLEYADGALFASEEETNALYRIELPSLAVTQLGVPRLADGSPLSILGGDLAVSAAGDWYLWTNSREALYRLDLADGSASRVGADEWGHGFHSGLAFDPESGGVLALARDRGELVVFDLETGRPAAAVTLCLACPAPYPTSSGDLASARCTDRDADGFAREPAGCGPVDCNDADAAIHPGAAEVCNAADDDCDGSQDGGAVCLPCPRSRSQWKRQPAAWPVHRLALGARTYARPALLALLRAASHGDASLRLAQHLIAAKLSTALGADPAPALDAVARADALLARFPGALPYHVRPGSRSGREMLELLEPLRGYGEGALTPLCVPRPERGPECRY